jgi:tRNA nucleotidyltransferase (CCA-adding enzyme)
MKTKFIIPDYVQKVSRMLIKEGYKCYLVGGALRDVVLGITPEDYDLATDAKPEAMMKIFPKSVETNARFGTILALVSDRKGERHSVEVTTFRSEANYVDGRWPSKVEFVDDLDLDLGRRDFTFNAMALDLDSALLDGSEVEREWEIYDPFNGLRDLGLKVVRAVGTPLERFKEDGLRAYKACRMAAQLEFDIETETFEAITKALPVAAQISMERVRDEFMKMIINSSKPSIGIELMRKTGLLELFMPELIEGYGMEQKLFHADDVYTHSLRCCDMAVDRVKLAALFHDIGKPRKDMGNGHFYGHDLEGEKMTREIMKRMKFSNAEIEHTANLVRNHMFYYPHITDDMTEEEKANVKAHEWSDSAVRRFIMRVGEENIDDLFELRIADAISNPKTAFDETEIKLLQERISKVREEDMALKISDLKITGNELMEMGVEKGPELGIILNELLEKVIDDPMVNTKEELKKLVEEMK